MCSTLRPSPGRVAPVVRLILVGCAFSLMAFAARSQVRVPLPQILAEAEMAIAARNTADAAMLIDMVLLRAEGGEVLPPGLDIDRLRLVAATTHFQSGSHTRSEEVALALVQSGRSGTLIAEARMILGLSLALQNKFAEAVIVFAALEESASHRERARLYGAMAAVEAGQIDVAIGAYARLLGSAPRDADWADAALVLISLHVRQKNYPEARRGLDLLQGQRELVDNVAGLNGLCLQLGDALLAEGDPEGALAAYRQILPRAELIRMQAARNERMTAQMARASAMVRGPIAELDAYRRLQSRLERASVALDEIEKLEGYDAAWYYRLGHAFQERGGAWEAALAFTRVLAESTEETERTRAHLGLIRAYADAGRFSKAQSAAESFAAAHPGHELVLQSFYIGALAAQSRHNLPMQLTFLEKADGLPGPEALRESIVVLHAHALLVASRFPEARQKTAAYQSAYPRGQFLEEAMYLGTMAGMLMGQQQRAVEEIESYLAEYPGGRFEVDARFRLAAAHYAMENYDEAIDRANRWLADQPEDHAQRGEVLSLLGDAYAGAGRIEEAVASYDRALAQPLPDEQLGYVLDELTKHRQARGERAEAIAMWEAFARERPDHPFVINAAYWIGRIRLQEGQVEEAQSGVAAIARRYLSDPTREGVERLLVDLAAMAARRRPPDEAGGAGVLPFATAAGELESLLLTEELAMSPTARARVLFVQSELAGLRNETVEQSGRLDRIAREFPADALPPGILGRVGDHLLANGRRDEARSLFEHIVTHHQRSIFADFGFVGLGEVALAEGRPLEALKQFDAAIDEAGARFKLREATLGRARALLALRQWEGARELFEQIAGHRAWRGEATAESLYSLGEILAQRGGRENLAQAQAHFQRVYISYRKFVPWVARAYLRSANTFAELGQYAEATATVREMLRDERLGDRPETHEASRRLAEWEARGAQEESDS